MNLNKPTTLTVLALLAFAGCKKDTVEPPAPTPSPAAVDATVRLNFTFLNGTQPFALGSTELHDSLGHAVKLDGVRFFASGAHAMDDNGDAVGHYEGTFLLVDASQPVNDFLLGTIHAAHIHEFHFDLGLDPATNAGDPATAAAPLDDTSMWFDAMMGYKFLVATGTADIDGDGIFETPVNYACGMDMLLTGAHAHVHHDLVQGEVFTAQVGVDLGLLFNGLDLAVDAAPMMDAPASQRMMENLSTGIDGME